MQLICLDGHGVPFILTGRMIEQRLNQDRERLCLTSAAPSFGKSTFSRGPNVSAFSAGTSLLQRLAIERGLRQVCIDGSPIDKSSPKHRRHDATDPADTRVAARRIASSNESEGRGWSAIPIRAPSERAVPR